MEDLVANLCFSDEFPHGFREKVENEFRDWLKKEGVVAKIEDDEER